MQGERDYYSVEDAAAVLGTTPARVLQMLTAGDLEGLPPGASAEGVWKVLLPATPERDPAQDEVPTEEESADVLDATQETPEVPTEVEEEPPEAAAAEDLSRGDNAATIREPTAPSGWVSTQQAARALGISPRTVRWHIEQGNLEASPEGEGVKRTWLVSIDSLQAFRDARRTSAPPRDYRASAEDADIAAESTGNAIRELADRLVEEAARASEFRVRLELTEQAASSVRAELEEERRRREEAERERDDLRRQLEAAREPRESPESATVEPERAEPRATGPGPQETLRRPWWRRVFRG